MGGATRGGTTSLVAACFFGHAEVARMLVGSGARACGAALIAACRSGEEGAISAVLDSGEGVDVNASCSNGINALIALCACESPAPGVVKELLRRGCRVGTMADNGMNAMHSVCQYSGSVEVAELLVASDRGLVDTPTSRDHTPLLIACSTMHVEMVEWLLRKGANPRDRRDGRTLFMAAVKPNERSIAVLCALERHGVTLDPHAADSAGNTASSLAARSGRPEIVAFVARQGLRGMSLCEFVRLLVGACADPDALLGSCEKALSCSPSLISAKTMDEGKTALCALCAHLQPSANRHRLVEWLLSAGAQPSEPDAGGWTPLHYAAHFNDFMSVSALLRHGASTRESSDGGCTPVFTAAASGSADAIIRMLLHDPLCHSQRRADGSTPLFIAAQSGHAHVVRALVAHGAQPSLALLDGRTPLSIASRTGSSSVTRLLLRLMRRVSRRLPPLPPQTSQRAFSSDPLFFDEDELSFKSATDLRIQQSGTLAEADSVWASSFDDCGATFFSHSDDDTAPVAPTDPPSATDQVHPFDLLVERQSKRRSAADGIMHRALEEAVMLRGQGTSEQEGERFEETDSAPLSWGEGEEYIGFRARDSLGMTALHAACIHGHTDIALDLLAHGARWTDEDVSGTNALSHALKRRMEDTALALIDHTPINGTTPLFTKNAFLLACSLGLDRAAISMLSKTSSPSRLIEAKGPHGETPLYFACCSGSHPLVSTLICSGADVAAQGPSGKHCLVVAAERGFHKVVSSLLLQPHCSRVATLALHSARSMQHMKVVNIITPLFK